MIFRLCKSIWTPAILGTFLATAFAFWLPVFAGFDEPAHFSSLLSYRFDHGHPKHPGSFFHAQVEEAMKLVPSPVHQLKPWKDFGGLSYRDWAALPEDEKNAKTQQYLNLHANEWQEGSKFGNWQAQHPPLYYWAVGNALKLFSTKSISEIFSISRVLSVLIFSSFYFLLTYFICCRWNYDIKIIWWSIFLPMPYVLGARITNDAMAIPFFTASILLYFDLLRKDRNLWKFRDTLLLSLSLCLTLGSKSYVLSLGPVLFAMCFILLYLDRDLSFFQRFKRPVILGLPLIVMLCVWSPWLYANWQRTGSITGMNELADLRAWGLDTPEIRWQKIKELYTEKLGSTAWIWLGVVVHLMFISHWFAGTAFPPFYVFQGLIYLVPLYLFYRINLNRRSVFNLNTLMFFFIVGAFLYGWFKFILDLYMYHGRPEWVGGWYYWATGAALIVFFAEIFSQLPTKIQRLFVVLQIFAFAWTVITAAQFFSGHWDRHPVYKYPVRIK